jgi:superfamily I DNA/RNA helicase
VAHAAANEAAEAEFVAGAIESLLGGHDLLAANRKGGGMPTGRPLGFADCAVLYRTDAQAGALRTAFDRAGIPFMKSSPAPIAGHPGVTAILDGLDGVEGQELAARIGQAAEDARRARKADAAALAEARGWLIALASSDQVTGDPLLRLGEATALSTEADFRDARAARVTLMTMHAAKGLEFPVVFVVGMEDGIVPFSWGAATPQEEATQAEERRLFYVAMTRAKDRLFLTRAKERFWHGAVRALPPSPFLGQIAGDLMVSESASGRKSRQTQQLNLF